MTVICGKKKKGVGERETHSNVQFTRDLKVEMFTRMKLIIEYDFTSNLDIIFLYNVLNLFSMTFGGIVENWRALVN